MSDRTQTTKRFWAVISRSGLGGYCLDVYPGEEGPYRRSLREGRERIIGEFDSAVEVSDCLKKWLETPRD